MKKEIVCGLDIGSSRLAIVAVRGSPQQGQLLAYESQPVRGLKKGTIQDLASLVDCIQSIVEKIKVKSNLKVRKILVSINGNFISARNSVAAVAFSEMANRPVNRSDIAFLRRQARLLGLRIDEFLLHEFPQDYILDDAHSTRSPLGLLARKVQLHSYLLSVSHSHLGNITTAIEQAGYEVVETVSSGIASSLSVLSEEERKRGVVLLDMGACFTNILFFKDGTLRDYKTINCGGDDFTDDISVGLGLPWELAEELKRSSLAVSSEVSRFDSLLIRRTAAYETLERRKLYESVKIRLEKLIGLISETIKASMWADKLECGIVGIGGTALVEGILETIEHSTGVPVRLGAIKKNTFCRESIDSQYAAAVGLLYHYWFNSVQSQHLRNSFIGRNNIERSVNFIQHVFREYF